MTRAKCLAYVGSMCAGAIFVAGFSDSSPFAGAFEYARDSSGASILSEQPKTPGNTGGIAITHIPTPDSVKAIYMSSWVAATPSMREKLVRLIDETEINAVIIDVKDYTGKISFPMDNAEIKRIGSYEKRIPDIVEFIDSLHKKGVYVIGRVAVFQDPYYARLEPKFAVKRSDGALWKDRKGALWLDAGAIPVWEYAIVIAKESYRVGFDEINFDYIRFPSDGNMNDIVFPISGNRPKEEVVREMWQELGWAMKKAGIPSSADVFGMTTTAQDDMNIGQIFEDSLSSFDFSAPMVYPSHYPGDWNGIANPAAHPYEVIKYSIGAAVERAQRASSSQKQIRPWLQDFDLGADYGAKEVRAQIQALDELGVKSWMLWDPSNQYTRGALKGE